MKGITTIILLVISYMLFAFSKDAYSVKAPMIISEYILPDYNWFESFYCRKRNRYLESTCDPHLIRRQAVEMVCDENTGQYNIGQICDIFDFFQTNWSYVSDPYRAEFFASAQQSLTHYRGDCDDFSIALATSIRAIGGLCRIVAAYHIEGGHAYVQVCLGATNLLEIDRYLEARYPENGPEFEYSVQTDEWGNRWLNLDSQHLSPGGAIAKAQYGYIFILGHPEYCLELD